MKTAFTYLSLTALVAVLGGCKPVADQAASGTGASDVDSDAPIIMDEMPPMMDDAHGHPEHGPHGGDLVELGKEAFHAELVHGDGGISMYVLDGAATEQVPIASEKLVVSLIVLYVAVFALYYERIMFAEEAFLRRRFGRDFVQWASQTAALMPRLRGWQRSRERFDCRNRAIDCPPPLP